MTRREAALFLGVREHAAMDKIKDAHKRVMVANHPDAGGSHYITSKINEARDMLMALCFSEFCGVDRFSIALCPSKENPFPFRRLRQPSGQPGGSLVWVAEGESKHKSVCAPTHYL